MELFITVNPYDTPFPKTLREIRDHIATVHKSASFVVAREVAKHEHYHLYIKDPSRIYTDANRNWVRRYLGAYFNGEVRISKRPVEDKIRAIAYTIKDGNYITHRIDWFDYIKAKDVSHPKPKKFQGQLSDFYLNASGKNDRQLTCEVLKIFEDSNVPIDIYRVAKIVRTAMCKHDNTYRNGLIDRILCEI